MGRIIFSGGRDGYGAGDGAGAGYITGSSGAYVCHLEKVLCFPYPPCFPVLPPCNSVLYMLMVVYLIDYGLYSHGDVLELARVVPDSFPQYPPF